MSPPSTPDPEQTVSLSQCPLCGFQPIPDGAVKCPRCQKSFTFALRQIRADLRQSKANIGAPGELRQSKASIGAPASKRHISVDQEAATLLGTSIDQVPSFFVPGPAAVLLLAGAAIWFLRVLGLGASAGEPAWVYAVVAVDLLLLPVVLLNLRHARLAAAAAFALQLLLSAALAGAAFFHPAPLFYELHAVAGLVATAGSPGPVRRRGAMLGGLLAAVLAGVLLGRSPAGGELRKELVSLDMGYRLVLPQGYDRIGQEQLPPHLTIPRALAGSSVAFGGGGALGVLTVERDRNVQLIGGCQSYLESLGAQSPPRPAEGPAPSALGEVALVYELHTTTGDVGRLGCGKLDDGRFVALAVVTADRAPAAAQAAFDMVGQGLTVK